MKLYSIKKATNSNKMFVAFGTEEEPFFSTIERYAVPFSQIFAPYCLKFGVRFKSR